MTLGELRRLGISAAPQISKDEVTLVWASGYWDGPLDGLARFNDSLLWFSLAEESEDDASGWYRRFWLIRLTPEQLELEQRRHADFQKFVGTHFDYDDNFVRNPNQIRPQSEWSKFYDKYEKDKRDPGDLSDNEVVGWFEW